MSTQRGFTVIETVIYVAILGIFIGALLVSVDSVFKNSERTSTHVVNENEANFLLRKFSWVLTNVSNINVPTVGATSTMLSVNKLSGTTNPIVLTVTASSTITIKKGTGPATAISSPYIPITNVLF